MSEPDLNLLRVFDVLMSQRSVTRAAERLNVTQSAVSHALRRLRDTLGDPLFVRSSDGLQPTLRAEEIAPGIREALTRLRAALNSPTFDPAQASRRFTVAMSGYFCTLLAPLLVREVQTQAPQVTLRIVPVTDALLGALERGAVDVALGGRIEAPARYVVESMGREDLVWIAAPDHPLAAQPFDAARVAALPRAVIRVPKPVEALPTHEIDQFIPRLFVEAAAETDESVVSVYDGLTAIDIIAASDLVGVVPRRLAAPAMARGAITILSPAIAAGQLTLLWHARSRADEGLRWLTGVIRGCLAEA